MNHDHSVGRCLVGVNMSIIEPGSELSEDYLEVIFDSAAIWKLPPGCKTMWDCVQESRKEVYHVIPEAGPMYEASRQMYCFKKWAVCFEFSHIGQSLSSLGLSSATSPLEWEASHLGADEVFGGYENYLIEVAQPMVDRLNEKEGTIHSVCFATIWSYESGWSYSYEGAEWESSWWLEGRFNLDTLSLEAFNPS